MSKSGLHTPVKRPYVLSIAGLDPSSGAGLTADIKTFERLKCYGFSICTGNTIQNDTELKGVYWTELSILKQQIDLLFNKFDIGFVKIGIVENWEILNELLDYLLAKNQDIKVIIDPVLQASSSFKFHDSQTGVLKQILEKTYLLTPNYQEIQDLYPERSISENIQQISNSCHLLLKGGHRETQKGTDVLFLTNGKQFTFNPKTKNTSEKHGSGCILSAAITAQLALGQPLVKACYKGKMYTEKALSSNNHLLAYHF